MLSFLQTYLVEPVHQRHMSKQWLSPLNKELHLLGLIARIHNLGQLRTELLDPLVVAFELLILDLKPLQPGFVWLYGLNQLLKMLLFLFLELAHPLFILLFVLLHELIHFEELYILFDHECISIFVRFLVVVSDFLLVSVDHLGEAFDDFPAKSHLRVLFLDSSLHFCQLHFGLLIRECLLVQIAVSELVQGFHLAGQALHGSVVFVHHLLHPDKLLHLDVHALLAVVDCAQHCLLRGKGLGFFIELFEDGVHGLVHHFAHLSELDELVRFILCSLLRKRYFR